ncbi:MAG: hypothetical protein OIF50_09525 [Flavobacteriaceae bacterium]|nr:hypothetical protein [Flavobacteriaceae bacterium]
MIKILRYTEYLYLFVAVASIYQIITLWNTDRNHAYIFVFFAVISVFMFWFRRKFRKRFDQRKSKEE